VIVTERKLDLSWAGGSARRSVSGAGWGERSFGQAAWVGWTVTV
jgi:hypothetical protein